MTADHQIFENGKIIERTLVLKRAGNSQADDPVGFQLQQILRMMIKKHFAAIGRVHAG